VDVHFLEHGQHEIAQAGFVVLRLAAKRAPFVVAEGVIFLQVRPVVVEMPAVLEGGYSASL
jgi:hypothetical protein